MIRVDLDTETITLSVTQLLHIETRTTNIDIYTAIIDNMCHKMALYQM